MPLRNIEGIYVINLKRRPDRLETFFKGSGLSSSNVHVHTAFDGKAVTEWTAELETLFANNQFNSLAGAVGAAKSHYEVWIVKKPPPSALPDASTPI